MRPAKLDLPIIWRGCTWPAILLIWKDVNGDPMDLTNWTPFAQTTTGINLNPIIVDTINGITTLHMSREETADLRLGTVGWDWVWWFNQSGNGFKYPPVLSGNIQIKEPTTKDFA